MTDTRNQRHPEAPKLVSVLRMKRQDSQLTGLLTILLSPISRFHLNLSSVKLSAIRKAIYVTKTSPLFVNDSIPNFLVFLKILNFVQYNLTCKRHCIGTAALDVLGWDKVDLQGDFTFQPYAVITKDDFV